jgi:hypothetical protein
VSKLYRYDVSFTASYRVLAPDRDTAEDVAYKTFLKDLERKDSGCFSCTSIDEIGDQV